VGGKRGQGTIFSATTAGAETMLYSFKGSPKDGGYPYGELLNFGGTLYGTTNRGGIVLGGGSQGGTVFRFTP
ncbi:MAG: hypothetical protein JO104_10860, partial [Candidatus Eremiobacteraeota bacterium]|nr:hypothetical protein [Candidatus Eremiobacteraeota bacterium]